MIPEANFLIRAHLISVHAGTANLYDILISHILYRLRLQLRPKKSPNNDHKAA
jgi:hypothetical protein